MTVRVRLDTKRQAVRLAFGLLVIAGVAALFATAALVTADSLAKQIGAWVCCAVAVAVLVAVAWGGALAMRHQAIVVSSEGIARDAEKQPWRVGWYELDAVTVETSWREAGDRYSVLPARFRLKTWRVVVRVSPKDAASFAADHAVLDVYRGRFGASADEWGIWLGPAKEFAARLDEPLRTYGGGVYRGRADLGRAPANLFAPTGAARPIRNRST